MKEKASRVYADTSVFGGAFDEEFSAASNAFFNQVRQGDYRLVISPLVRQELRGSPDQVREFFKEISQIGEESPLLPESIRLQEAYLEEAIVSSKWEADALHVAHATVTGCEMIVSWNFRHIVHFQKIELYNAINVKKGYAEIRVHSPQEVIEYEEENL